MRDRLKAVINLKKAIQLFINATSHVTAANFRHFIGVSPRTYEKILNNKPVQMSVVYKIARTLNVPVNDIVSKLITNEGDF